MCKNCTFTTTSSYNPGTTVKKNETVFEWLAKESDKFTSELMGVEGEHKGIWKWEPPKCECGKEKAGDGGRHSDWCPKYEGQF